MLTPQQMTDDQIRAIVKKIVTETKSSSDAARRIAPYIAEAKKRITAQTGHVFKENR